MISHGPDTDLGDLRGFDLRYRFDFVLFAAPLTRVVLGIASRGQVPAE